MCLRAVIVSSLRGAASLTAPSMSKSSIFSQMHRARSASVSLTFMLVVRLTVGPSFVPVNSIVHYPSKHFPPSTTSRRSKEDMVRDEKKFCPQLHIVWIVAKRNQMLVIQR